MVHENGKQRARHCGSFMIRMNNSKAFSRSSASWNQLVVLRANALEDHSGDDQPLRFRNAMLLATFLATASRRAASGNNDRLSTLWREVISFAGIARSLSWCPLGVTFQSLTRLTGISH
jgi:hypothetical protein